MSNKKRGRPESNTIKINWQLFDAALKHNNLSMAKLSTDPSIDVNEKTIRRIKKNNYTNQEMLNSIAKRLNVDPFWLTGECLEIAPLLKYNKNYMNPANHPYNKCKEAKKSLNPTQIYKDLLILQGILPEDYSLLSESEQNNFEMILDLLIKIAILSYFGPHVSKDNPFLSNQELIDLSDTILSCEAFKTLFELIML